MNKNEVYIPKIVDMDLSAALKIANEIVQEEIRVKKALEQERVRKESYERKRFKNILERIQVAMMAIKQTGKNLLCLENNFSRAILSALPSPRVSVISTEYFVINRYREKTTSPQEQDPITGFRCASEMYPYQTLITVIFVSEIGGCRIGIGMMEQDCNGVANENNLCFLAGNNNHPFDIFCYENLRHSSGHPYTRVIEYPSAITEETAKALEELSVPRKFIEQLLLNNRGLLSYLSTTY